MRDIQPNPLYFVRNLSRPATVTPLGGTPISTRIIEGSIPGARHLRMGIIEDLSPRCAVPRKDVPVLLDGSRITARLVGRDATWRVDAIERLDDDFYHVIVSAVAA